MNQEAPDAQATRIQLPESPGKEKNPTTALLLGGLVGFGAGQYYAGATDSGIIFTLLDSAVVTALGLGIYGIVKASSEKPEEEKGLSDKTVRTIMLSMGGVGFLGSRITQMLLGPESAKRFNEKFNEFQSKYRVVPVPKDEGIALKFKMRF